MKLKNFLLFLLLVCSSAGLFAQAIKFTASVNKNPVGTGDVFDITFSVNGNAEGFEPPDFRGFQVAGGPNESTSMESVNGATTVSASYSYELVPLKEGEFTIGAASVMINGRRLTSRPINIKVVKGRSVPQNTQTQNAPDNTVSAANTSDLSKLLFIRAVVDKSNVYLGQQITLNYRVYIRGVGIEQNQATILPELNGFWSEDIKQNQGQVQLHIETYKGIQYNVADIKKTILFPEHAGDLTIDPFGMSFILKVQAPSNDVMEQFFGSYKDVKYDAKSPPVIIHVKPLPEAGKPDNFTGAVGSFNVESSIDTTEIKANDALNYKVRVSGTGNIKLLKNLNVNFPADFEKYDPKITDSVIENENGVSGYRIYNYLLIPRHQGEYTIDPLKFSYFNPATGRYTMLTTKAVAIKVDKGNAQSNVTAFSDVDKHDIKMLSKDIRYIKTGTGDFTFQSESFYGSWGYYLLLLAGPCLCYCAYIYHKWLVKNNSDLVKVKSRQAGKIAARHLASAEKQLIAGNTQLFYKDIFKGLYGYLSDKLNIQYASLNRETIAYALKNKKVNDVLTGQLQDTLDLCEMARYAPVTHISEKEVFEKAKNIINQIENEI